MGCPKIWIAAMAADQVASTTARGQRQAIASRNQRG
jgi:hypothetical protein